MRKFPYYPSENAVRDFQKELRIKQAEYDLQANRQLAEATGIKESTLYGRTHEPLTIRCSDMRAIVQVLHPNPAVILSLMGYTDREIKRFKEGT